MVLSPPNPKKQTSKIRSNNPLTSNPTIMANKMMRSSTPTTSNHNKSEPLKAHNPARSKPHY